IADGDRPRIDTQLVGCDLRERGFVTLAVVLRADVDHHRTVGQHADVGRFIAWRHSRLALPPLRDAVAALLGVEGEADADGAAVRLALLLALPNGRQIDHIAR